MKKVAIISIFAACMISCNSNRYAYVDVASSERTAEELENGFRNVPDSIKDGRTIFLMSQGIPVADILFYKGRLNNPTLPAVPYGYDYEYITEDQLINDLEVGYGRLYTKSGINARVLVILDKDVTVSEMTKIARLAQNGALIGGVRPTRCLDSADSLVFKRNVEKVWQNGNVMSGKTLESILRAARVPQDEKTSTDSLIFSHRHLPDAEIYRICNPTSRNERIRVKFRVTGRRPMLWNPDTGEIEPLSYNIKKKGTRVRFNIVPNDDIIIVFGPYADKKKMKIK